MSWSLCSIPPLVGVHFLKGGEQVSMVLVSWELMLFLSIYLFIYCFIILLFIDLFLVKGLFTMKCKYYTIFK